MRLIDADNLKEQIKAIHQAVDTTSVNTDYDTGFHSATSQVMGLVEFLPTVEAVPVVHGEWIRVPSSDMATGRAYECSNCKKMRYGSFMPPFCQMCGADMRTSAE